MKKDLLKLAGLLALVAALMTAAVEVEATRERAYRAAAEDDSTLYVRSSGAARRLALAYPALAADIYWIRAIQYYGGTKQHLQADLALAPPPKLSRDASVDYPLLYPLLDLTTSLDPRFHVAYRFGAVFLAEPFPNGPGRPDLAVELLEKGLRERPDKWEYMEDIGFVHYWYTHDYAKAAFWFAKAADLPGAPWWIRSLAATTLAQGGDRQSSRQMWAAIRESAEIDWLKQDAERRLVQLNALDQIDQLNARVDAFVQGTGQRPGNWASLVRAGFIQGIPLDPTGTPYELSSEGRVLLSQRSRLWPLPEEPAATSRRQ